MSAPKPVSCVGSAPRMRTKSRTSPISSKLSRKAASAGVLSSASIRPPGKESWLAWSRKWAARRVKEELRPGDVVLVKGRDNERLDRVALALLGRDVRCAIDFCKLRSGRCEGCSHLEKGWAAV